MLKPFLRLAFLLGLGSVACAQITNLSVFTPVNPTISGGTFTAAPYYRFTTPSLYVATAGNGGSDTNDCLAATLTGGHGPCLTPQYAVDVAMQTDMANSQFVINIGAGTFQAPQISGSMRGNGGNGISGQYLVLYGAGSSSTTLTDLTGRAFVLEVSDGADVAVGQLSINIPSNHDGIFAQNSAIVEIFNDLKMIGTDNTSTGWHIEAYGMIELGLSVNPTFQGSFNAGVTIGINGYLQFDPSGPSTLTCSGTVTFANSFLFMQTGTALFGNGWTFPNCNTAVGTRYILQNNAAVVNSTGVNLPGNAARWTLSGGVLTPYVAPSGVSSTGLGTGGLPSATCANCSSRSGIITLTTGSTSPLSTGIVSMTLNEIGFSGGGAFQAPCTASPTFGASGWQSNANANTYVNNFGNLQFQWNNGGVALTANTSYAIQYVCVN